VELSLAEAISVKDERRVDELVAEISALKLDTDLDGAVHEEYQGLDAGELLKTFERENLIRVAPPSLNRRLQGGVIRGNHIVVVAYPETGKTLVTMTMTAGFVQQGLKVLYIGNEDPIKSVIVRFISCLTGKTASKIAEDPKGTMHRAIDMGYKNAVFAGLSGGTLEDIRALLVKHKPDALIVDQIRNISTKSENRTQQLETVARAMRDFAREFSCVAVSVTQGADSSRNKLMLDMGDVDGSNVGIPGTADVMLMIGMNEDYSSKDRRHFCLAKNKVGGNHESWPVLVKPQLSRVVDAGA
jgi:archaellum biogenesis ATPase FlaH